MIGLGKVNVRFYTAASSYVPLPYLRILMRPPDITLGMGSEAAKLLLLALIHHSILKYGRSDGTQTHISVQ